MWGHKPSVYSINQGQAWVTVEIKCLPVLLMTPRAPWTLSLFCTHSNPRILRSLGGLVWDPKIPSRTPPPLPVLVASSWRQQVVVCGAWTDWGNSELAVDKGCLSGEGDLQETTSIFWGSKAHEMDPLINIFLKKKVYETKEEDGNFGWFLAAGLSRGFTNDLCG